MKWLARLVEAEKQINLSNPEAWKSLLVDYHPPIVERLYMDLPDVRVYLHEIHPCEREEALYHRHPWPSAVHVFDGPNLYEMGIGYGEQPPPKAATTIFRGELHYEMPEPLAWHYVRPIGGRSYSVMVAGRRFEPAPRERPELKELSPRRKEGLLDVFYALIRKAEYDDFTALARRAVKADK